MRQNSDEFSLEIDGNSIKRTENFKYLGVVLDCTLSFNEYIQCMKKKLLKYLSFFQDWMGNSTSEKRKSRLESGTKMCR